MKNQDPKSSNDNSAPAVIVPVAFEQHDKSLKQEQLAFAIKLGEKFPAVVSAATEMRASFAVVDGAMREAGQKYFGLCSALRVTKMNRRESALLLKGLGFIKSRVSEILRVSEVSDAIWSQYSAKTIGFKAALALDAGKSSAGGTDGEGAEEEAAKVSAKKAKTKIHEVPASIKNALSALCTEFKRPLKGGNNTEYAAAFVKDGVRYYFAISTSATTAKA